jgi:phosphate/sulfate permease
VIWSGSFNFLGVLTSSGAVAYSVVTPGLFNALYMYVTG